MDKIWQNLKRDEERAISPDWHKDELAATERRVISGEETFMDWEAAKKLLRQRFKSKESFERVT